MMIYRGEGFFSFFFFLPSLPLHLSLSLSLPNFYSIRDSTRKLLSSPSNFFRKLEKANDTFESVETSGGLVGGFRAKKCEEWREQHHPGDDGSKVGCPADRKPIIHLNTKPERCTWLKLALFPFLSSPRFPPSPPPNRLSTLSLFSFLQRRLPLPVSSSIRPGIQPISSTSTLL